MDPNNFLNRGRLGSEYWINSELKTFEELCKDNILQHSKWKNSKSLLSIGFENKILKPANEYARIFSNKPEIIQEKDQLKLRYKTHAEIWFETKPDGFYCLDKVMQRQFYPSELDISVQKTNFDAIYKFYTPWIIDSNKSFLVEQIDSSPFFIYNKEIFFNEIKKDKEIWDIGFVHFSIKNSGDHIRNFNDDVFGILDAQTPMYDIIIKDKEIIKRILSE